MTPRQIPLDLPVTVADTRDDLVVGEANRLAVQTLDAWPDWPGTAVILHGPSGSGKSHMARIWSGQSGAALLAMGDLREGQAPPSSHLVLENAEPGSIPETALFHLLNHLRAEKRNCLITSRHLPSQWRIALADLRSRIDAATLLRLGTPDDDMLRRVVVKLFADRQLAPDPGVVRYLAQRMERSVSAATRLVAEIDREALARSRRITRPIAAQALRRLGMG